MVNQSIVNSVKKYLQILTEKGLPIQQGVIFGSYARNQPNQWSDIDLLVVSPRFDGERKRADINLLWRVAARTDSRIEPIPVGQQQFKEDDSSAIIETARREGQVVYLDTTKVPKNYQKDVKKAVEILKSAGCSEIFLFGSLTTGQINSDIDLDLAVRGCPPGEFFHLFGQLLLELDHSVDLVNLDTADTFARYLETEGDLFLLD